MATTKSSPLAQAGVVLYGPRWRGQLARALGVTHAAVSQWQLAGRRVPPRQVAKIADLLRMRGEDVRCALEIWKGMDQ